MICGCTSSKRADVISAGGPRTGQAQRTISQLDRWHKPDQQRAVLSRISWHSWRRHTGCSRVSWYSKPARKAEPNQLTWGSSLRTGLGYARGLHGTTDHLQIVRWHRRVSNLDKGPMGCAWLHIATTCGA